MCVSLTCSASGLREQSLFVTEAPQLWLACVEMFRIWPTHGRDWAASFDRLYDENTDSIACHRAAASRHRDVFASVDVSH